MNADTPNPYEPLGLPPTWQPTPLGPAIHVLLIDGSTGRQAFAFDDAALRAMGERAIAQATGLTIVGPDGNGRVP